MRTFNIGKCAFAIRHRRVFAPGVGKQFLPERSRERGLRCVHAAEVKADGSVYHGIGHNSSHAS